MLFLASVFLAVVFLAVVFLVDFFREINFLIRLRDDEHDFDLEAEPAPNFRVEPRFAQDLATFG